MPSEPSTRIREEGATRLLVLDSSHFEADMAYVESEKLDGVECNFALGFQPEDLKRLPAYRFRQLRVSDPRLKDASPIEEMPWLTSLGLIQPHALDLRSHTSLKYLAIEFHPRLRLPVEMQCLETLRLWKDKPKSRDLTPLPEAPKLTWLSTVQANIASLRGIGRFPRLRKLTLAYLRSLTDITALGELPNLEELEVQNCPNVNDFSALRGAASLRTLIINQNKPISSIGFVRDLPSLQHLGLYDTDVTDGDMSPCIGIGWVGFMDRPHLSHKLRDVREETRRLGKTLPPLTSPVG